MAIRNRILAFLAASVLAQVAAAQSATVRLTPDDTDGVITAGQVVTWTLQIEFEDALVADSGNMRILASPGWLLQSSDFEYLTETNGGNNGGASDGQGGIEFINWKNSLFIEGFGGGPPIDSNPFVVGQFTTIATADAVPDFRFELGQADAPFLRLGVSAFFEPSFDIEDVEIIIERPRIEPLEPGAEPGGSDEPCDTIGPVPLPYGVVDGVVYTALLTDAGDLIVGGNFTSVGLVGGVPELITPGIARWDGSQWRPFGDGLLGRVLSLLELPDGRLLAGGDFQNGHNVAVWNGVTWQPFGSGLNGPVSHLAQLPDGTIAAGGWFTVAQGSVANNLAAYDGTDWTPEFGSVQRPVLAMAVLPNGDLVIGGNFTSVGSESIDRVARWDGQQWHALGWGLSGTVNDLLVGPDGTLYAGGEFEFSRRRRLDGVAWFDGNHWNMLGDGLGGQVVRDLASTGFGQLVAMTSSGVYLLDDDSWGQLVDTPAVALLGLEDEFLSFGVSGIQGNVPVALPPRVSVPPVSQVVCPGDTVSLVTLSDGPAAVHYRWQLLDAAAPSGWRDLLDGNEPGLGRVTGSGSYRLRITDVQREAVVRCIISNECNDVATEAVTVLLDPDLCCLRADLNQDGVLTTDDLTLFIDLFLLGYPRADFNLDRVLDHGDVEALVRAWLGGCR